MIRTGLPRVLISTVMLLAGSPFALGQGLPKELVPTAPAENINAPFVIDSADPTTFRYVEGGNGNSTYLSGNQAFPNFIGFISNPIQSIDPRAGTNLWPMFGSAWVSANRSVLPSGDMQVYGAGLNVALSDRFSFGMNQGGYAIARFEREREVLRRRLGLPLRELDRGGSREGWLNLGGYFQYTLIADVPNQFLLTAGMRFEVPTGATQLFQGGGGPAYLSPYLTVGKEYGPYHILATTGYEFPAGSGEATTQTAYFNLHLDRKIGWLYPLIEFNYAYRRSSTDISIITPRHGVIDLGTFTSNGNTVTAAIGANAILIPNKLELGAVYSRPLTSNNQFDFQGMLVKMMYRY